MRRFASTGSVPPHAANDPRAPRLDGRSRQSVTKGGSYRCSRNIASRLNALTKVLLALEEHSEPLLRRLGASAHLYDGQGLRGASPLDGLRTAISGTV